MNAYEIGLALPVLKKARKILEAPEAWTQHTYGRDANRKAAATPEEAVCFCAIGAILKAGNAKNFARHSQYLDGDGTFHAEGVLESYVTGVSVAMVNDRKSTTHMQILNAFDLAILQASDDLKALNGGGSGG